MASIPVGSSVPAAPGSLPFKAPEGAPTQDVMAAFASLLTRLAMDPSTATDLSVAGEARPGAAKLDEALAPEDVWAAIWFPAGPASPDSPAPAAVALPPNQTAHSQAAVAESGDESATLSGIGVGSVPMTALRPLDAAGTKRGVPADGQATAASDAPATGFPPLLMAEAGSAEITPAEVLALVDSATTSAGSADAGAMQAANASSSTSAPTAAVDWPTQLNSLRDSALAISPQILDLRQAQAPQQLAESIAWHLDQGLHEITIDLHPVELGKMEIRLKLEGERVDVRFDTADVAVRDVVQTSLPHLAAMLATRGLQLDQAQVFAQARPFSPAPTGSASNSGTDDEQPKPVTAGPRVIRRGLVDDYV